MYFSPPRKSETCFSCKGTPLTEYGTFEEAQNSADYEHDRNYEVNLVPYQCGICGKFHLKPKAFYVPKLNRNCNCTDTYGNAKDAYPSETAARKMAEIRANAGVRLWVYRCPDYENVWHLTSHPFYR